MNRSLYFPGTAYVTTPSFALSGTVLTVIGSVKMRFNATAVQTILGEGAASGTVGCIVLSRFFNENSLKWLYANGSPNIYASMDSFFTGYDNAWLSYAVVCDYTVKTIKFYRNGAWLQTSNMTGTPVFPSTSRVKYLGAYSTTGNKIANGNLGPQRIYTRGLSDAEILADYNGQAVDPTGLQLEYLMTEGQGSTIADTSGNNRTGAIHGATWSGEFASVGGITSLEAFGLLSLAAWLSLSGIASLEVFGLPWIWMGFLGVGGITSLEAFGALSLSALLSPSGIASMEAFGVPWIEIFKLLILKISAANILTATVSAADIISLQISDSELIKMEVT